MALRACCQPCSRQMLYKKLRQVKESEAKTDSPNLPQHISSENNSTVSSISHASSTPPIVDLSTSEVPPKANTWWSGYVTKATASASITVDSTDSSSSSTTKKSRQSSKEVNRIRCENAMKRRDSQVGYK